MTIRETFIQALLADASYVHGIDPSVVPSNDLARLLAPRMTKYLADAIAGDYTVVAQVAQDEYAISGFDATIWRGPDGKLTVSMRGTEFGPDLFPADIDLAVTGGARFQLRDMINWWLRITTPASDMAPQVQLAGPPLAQVFVPAPAVLGAGIITAGDLAAGVAVNGHSLGGYLAGAFTRLFEQQAKVSHVSTFNAAGFAITAESWFQNLELILPDGLGHGRFPDETLMTNYFATHGINVTTNSLWFSQQGHRIDLFNEESTGLPNHYMYKLTDALALGAALEELDPSLTIEKFNRLMGAASNEPAKSLETILDLVRSAVLGQSAPPTPVGDAAAEAASRVKYHEFLADLQESPQFEGLLGQLSIDLADGSLRSIARNDFAAFVALADLSPVLVKGINVNAQDQLTAKLRARKADLYALWEQDRESATPENYSSEWLDDRALMLARLVERNMLDLGPTESGASGVNGKPAYFHDVASDTQFYAGGSFSFSNTAVYRFGTDGNDSSLQGGVGDDHLHGGRGGDTLLGLGGDDKLYGGGDNDRAEGGSGDDQIHGDAGNDTLDGGSDGDVLVGGRGDDELQGGAAADWLWGDEQESGASASRYAGANYQGKDTLKGGDGADTLVGGGGNDDLQGGDGNDVLRGDGIDAGDTDRVGDDTLTGGSGKDTLYGGEGNDTLYGGSSKTDTDTYGNILYGNAGEDQIYGDGGKDTLEGGEDNDTLVGNLGDDSLKGGDGNDKIYGESERQGDVSTGKDTIEGGEGNDTIYGGGGADSIKGEEGNDELRGEVGTDTLDGGAGFDTYIVGEGKDTLRDDEAGRGTVRTKEGFTFTGGAETREGSQVWESADKRVVYTRSGSNLVAVRDGDSANSFVVENFDFEMAKNGSYVGISLGKATKTPPPGGGGVSGGVGGGTSAGSGWRWPGDPLVLDMDADGFIELTGNGAVLFDHDGDRVKTGSQWVRPDDGLLVRDLDGNGTIDSGRELFGDGTVLPGGGRTSDGFVALGVLDANGDRTIDAQDAAFGSLQVWRDANQDGISQAGELQSLEQAGITGIDLDARRFERDGQQHAVANVGLVNTPFLREFLDPVPLTDAAEDLPDMGGAGVVRDLREAMSLGGAAAGELQARVEAFRSAGTAMERQALIDEVLDAWAATSAPVAHGASGRPGEEILLSTGTGWRMDNIEQLFAPQLDAAGRDWRALTAIFSAANVQALTQMLLDEGLIRGSRALRVNSANTSPATTVWRHDAATVFFQSSEIGRRIGVLERFNAAPTVDGFVGTAYSDNWNGARYYQVSLPAPPQALFDGAYRILQEDVYRNLYLQTGARKYLDLVVTRTDASGVHHDFSAAEALIAQEIAADPAAAAVDLAEFLYFTREYRGSTGWGVAAMLDGLLDPALIDDAQYQALARLGYNFAWEGGERLTGSGAADALVGNVGDDVLVGQNGADMLFGGAGNDALHGGNGDDDLVGGAGDDYLDGGTGNDRYVWGRGHGNDTLVDIYADAGRHNSLAFRGLRPDEVQVEVLDEELRTLRFTILDTGETITVSARTGWYGVPDSPMHFHFADGTTWTVQDAARNSLTPSTGDDDTLVGSSVDDLPARLNGGDGNDVITGRGGHDVMEGGGGNDTLYGNGGLVDYWSDGEWRSRWGERVSYGDSDIYVFGRGDGQDVIVDIDHAGNTDVLRFKPNVAPDDVVFSQRGYDLVVRIRGTTDQVTVAGFFDRADTPYIGIHYTRAIELFEFADGTSWSNHEVMLKAWEGSEGDDRMSGDHLGNRLTGKDGNDVLHGLTGNDVLLGGAGNDLLDGGQDDDILDGGAGNDTLDAGYGEDVFRFGRGDGHDVIVNTRNWSMGTKTIELKEGLTPADVRIAREGLSLRLTILGTGDTLLVKDFLLRRDNSVQAPELRELAIQGIRFADGTLLGAQQILEACLAGSASSDVLEGFDSDDVFDGRGGNDIVVARGGADVILFGHGSGQDTVGRTWEAGSITLRFKEDVDPSQVRVRRVRERLVFTLADSGESIAFEDAFDWGWNVVRGLRTPQAVVFADGTTWDIAALHAQMIVATDGDDAIGDALTGTTTTLAGGLGNDTLTGTRGDTVYLFNRGDGRDVIDEVGNSNADTLRFGPGIVAADLDVRIDGADLVIGISGTDDQVRIREGYWEGVEHFEVGGITLTHDQIRALEGGGARETLFGSAQDDALAGSDKPTDIFGYGGNDTLSGNGGDDWVEGGEGDDVAYGGGGGDVLLGQEGSDALHGGDGEDELSGGDGDDSLDGGAGRDYLEGGAGRNVYRLAPGGALDRVQLNDGEEAVLELAEGIDLEHLTVQVGEAFDEPQDGWLVNRLVIGWGGNDAVMVQAPPGQAFGDATPVNLILRLADGTVLSLQDLLDMDDGGHVGEEGWERNLGSEADDRLWAEEGSDAYMQGRGNDDELSGSGVWMSAGWGNDTLEGSWGSLIAGDEGDDSIRSNGDYAGRENAILFNAGHGRDRIDGYGEGALSFGGGLRPEDARVWVDPRRGDLVISFPPGGDEVRMGWYDQDLEWPQQFPIRYVQFIDAQGGVRAFDLLPLMLPGFPVVSLVAAEASGGRSLFTDMPELAPGLPTPVFGGAAAFAYAQQGDMAAEATIPNVGNPDADNIIFGTAEDEVLDGGAGNDTVMGAAGHDVLLGGTGNDFLDGGEERDYLDGGEGTDVLRGGNDRDALHDSLGDDYAYGGGGSDDYFYNRGGGFFYIKDYPDEPPSPPEFAAAQADAWPDDSGDGDWSHDDPWAPNTLHFGAGISLADLRFHREGDDLVVTVAGEGGGRIVLAGFDEWEPQRNKSIRYFVFQDQEPVDLEELFESMPIGEGTAGGVELAGDWTSELLQGGEGADTLRGGEGVDTLEGGWGGDTYVFDTWDAENGDVIVDNAGEHNSIVFEQPGVTAGSIALQTDGAQAWLTFGFGTILLQGWDGGSLDEATIHDFVFSDGSTLTMAELFHRGRDIHGTPDADVLTGGDGDDFITGYEDDDILRGGGGSDNYFLGLDFGHDTIVDLATFEHGNSVYFADGDAFYFGLSVDGEGRLVMNFWDGNSLTLSNFDRLNPFGERAVDFFVFGDAGRSLSYEELLERGFTIEGTEQDDLLLGTSLTDEIYGGDGADMLDGGSGDDYLAGGDGDDTYHYDLGDGFVYIEDQADDTGGNTLQFGEGITLEMLDRKLRYWESPDEPGYGEFGIVFDDENEIWISGFDRHDPGAAPHGIERFAFADGTSVTWDELLDLVFVVEGSPDGDALAGTARSDRLYGYDGDDELAGGDGTDVLTGGTSNDILEGGEGDDSYVFQLGDGYDEIYDESPGNVILFGEGITADSIRVSISSDPELPGYFVEYGEQGDTIYLASRDGTTLPHDVIAGFELADGSKLRFGSFLNQAPEVFDVIGTRRGAAGQALAIALPELAFLDPDDDPLTYVARLANGDPLPEWLVFDPAGRTFAGTPPAGQEATYTLVIEAFDGAGLSASQEFDLLIGHNRPAEPRDDATQLGEDDVVAVGGNVLANDADPDGDALHVLDAGTHAGLYGTLTLQADGSYGYVLDAAHPAVQALGEGEQAIEEFTFRVGDGEHAASSRLVVTIVGANDRPVLAAHAHGVAEDAATEVAGDVLSGAFDAEGDALGAVDAGEYGGVYGTLMLEADGSYVYRVAQASTAVQALRTGETVVDTFVVRVSDGRDEATTTVTVTLTGANDAPIATLDVAQLAEEAVQVTGDVLVNDGDVDAGDTLSVGDAGTRIGAYGRLELAADGSYVYRVDAAAVQALGAGATVTDSFAYAAVDGEGAQSSAQLVVTVVGENDGPSALDDTVAAQEDGVAATGNVLANDIDIDAGDVLAVADPGARQGTHGTLELAADGSFRYLAGGDAAQALAAGETAIETFSYLVDDGHGGTATAALHVIVTGSNDGPTAVADIADVLEDGPAVSGNVLANDSDVDAADVLAVTGSGTLQGAFGTLELAADGSYSYQAGATAQTLAAGATGTDTFTYTVRDAQGALATSTLAVQVHGANDGPQALDDAALALEGGAASGNVLANDTDADASDVLRVGDPGLRAGAYGSLQLGVDGRYLYVADAAAAQALAAGETVVERFSYTVLDTQGASATATLEVHVTGTNDGPIAQADVAALEQDGMAVGNVLANDADADGSDALVVVDARTHAGSFGTLQLGADGSYAYTAGPAARGLGAGETATDTFTYTAADPSGALSTSTLSVQVSGRNDAPEAMADHAQVLEDGPALAGNVLSNDIDPDASDVLAVMDPGSREGAYGVLHLGADGGYTYAPGAAAQALRAGERVTETFDYIARDAAGATSTASVVITIVGGNDAPVGRPDAVTVAEDGPGIASNVLFNDGDVDAGDVLSVVDAGQRAGAYGTLQLDAAGGFTYVADSAAAQALGEGEVVTETFSYTVRDASGATSTSSLEVTVTGRNDAPEAGADAVALTEDGLSASGNVLGNDRDADAGAVLGVADPGSRTGSYGSLHLRADGGYDYLLDTERAQTLAAGQTVTDVFAYAVADGEGGQSSGQVIVTITGSNDAPLVRADSGTVSEDGVLVAQGNVLANDSDADAGDTLRVLQPGTFGGQYGTLTLGADGSYSYSLDNGHPQVQALDAGETLADTFTYTVADTRGGRTVAELTLTIAGADDESSCGRIITGTRHSDILLGTACADRIDGKEGLDLLVGGRGDDIYIVDGVSTDAGCRDMALADAVVELYGQGRDLVAAAITYVLPHHVENLMLTGTASLLGTGNGGDNVLVGNAGASTLEGNDGHDVLVGRDRGDRLDGGDGDDHLYGEQGNDRLDGGCGNDALWGGAGDDVICDDDGHNLVAAGAGNDSVQTGSGADVIVAGTGNDYVKAGGGNDLLLGGAGKDSLDGGSGNDFLAGGHGDDTIVAGSGRDVIAFNRGDGRDTVQAGGEARADTLSLGGGIRYADLTLRKSGSDLVLGVGNGEQITLKGWYASTSKRTVGSLQVLTEGGDYQGGSLDRLYNSKAVVFDFIKLVAKFDAARGHNGNLTWAVAGALPATLVEYSGTQARGGDLAYDYATASATGDSLGRDMDVQAVRGELAGLAADRSQGFAAAPAGGGMVDPWVALQAGTDLVVSQEAAASNPIGPVESTASDALLFAALNVAGEKPSWADQ